MWECIIRQIRINYSTHNNVDVLTNKGGKSCGGNIWHPIESQNNNHKTKYKHNTVPMLKDWKEDCVQDLLANIKHKLLDKVLHTK